MISIAFGHDATVYWFSWRLDLAYPLYIEAFSEWMVHYLAQVLDIIIRHLRH